MPKESTPPEAEERAKADVAAADKEAPPPADELVETHHRVTIGGKEIAYTATAGRIVMRTEEGKAKASIFFVAYTRDSDGPDADLSSRPITFTFNGGPGSASVWLHLGLFGPRRVVSGDVDGQLPPPYHLTDNEYSMLDTTDLVFIDPVSTGYSRPTTPDEAKEFHGLEADIESVGDFIRLYVSRYKRWRSPKFLAGESYGTTRAAGLADYLQSRRGMALNGLVLISVVFEFQTLSFETGNDLPYLLFLPTYTATAWYHKRLEPALQADLGAALAEAEAFAEGEYATALMRGNRLTLAQRTKIARKLARLTGLSAEYFERSNLRVSIWRFTAELLRDKRRTVGRLDSRFTGVERNAAGSEPSYDPSSAYLVGAYSGALNDYVRRELNFSSDLAYETLARLWDKWDWSKHQNRYATVAEKLRSAMTQNPWLRVYVASGRFDLATPFMATDYSLARLELDETLTSNIQVSYYDAGHMMYVHGPSLERLKEEMAAFYAETLAAK
jgi:carboxypeptidase C (cathepsin A)